MKKILIVDDEKDLRDALVTSFINAGFETVSAENGRVGLTIALEAKPDLILLDIMMPDMNGHEMLHTLRQDAWGKTVPVLLLTNADDAGNVVQGISVESNDYIIKSNTSLEEVVKRVKQYLAGYHD